MLLLLLLSHFSRVRLCDPIDGSLPGSPVPGILQARTLEWVAISFSNEWRWKVKVKLLSPVSHDSKQPHGLQPTRLLHPWDFPGKSTGVGCHCLLQHIHTTIYKISEVLEFIQVLSARTRIWILVYVILWHYAFLLLHMPLTHVLGLKISKGKSMFLQMFWSSPDPSP